MQGLDFHFNALCRGNSPLETLSRCGGKRTFHEMLTSMDVSVLISFLPGTFKIWYVRADTKIVTGEIVFYGSISEL